MLKVVEKSVKLKETCSEFAYMEFLFDVESLKLQSSATARQIFVVVPRLKGGRSAASFLRFRLFQVISHSECEL